MFRQPVCGRVLNARAEGSHAPDAGTADHALSPWYTSIVTRLTAATTRSTVNPKYLNSAPAGGRFTEGVALAVRALAVCGATMVVANFRERLSRGKWVEAKSARKLLMRRSKIIAHALDLGNNSEFD